MPIYEYRCPNCGHEFEKLVKFSDPPPPCPECGHPETAKRVSQTTFHLKGGGWYVTDYKDKPSATASPSDSGGGDSGGSDDASSSASADSSSDSGSSASSTSSADTSSSTSSSSSSDD